MQNLTNRPGETTSNKTNEKYTIRYKLNVVWEMNNPLYNIIIKNIQRNIRNTKRFTQAITKISKSQELYCEYYYVRRNEFLFIQS